MRAELKKDSVLLLEKRINIDH